MRDVVMTTSFVAPLARRDKTIIYQWFNTPECQAWLPPRTGIGESRSFTREQTVLLMLHSDLNRWGIPVPMAGRLVTMVAERLATSPEMSGGSFVFCENGASFFDVGSAFPVGVGRRRFSLHIDLAGYRATINDAVDAEVQVIGAEDAE